MTMDVKKNKDDWFRMGTLFFALFIAIYNVSVSIDPCPPCTNYGVRQARAQASEVVVEPLVTEWENNHDIVHVILTRFMQHQPKLLHLGRARLELFKSFCLPTMRMQTSSHFLWIIRADPQLHPDLKAEFLSTLQGIPNLVVVGSNARVDDGHFRHENSIADINESTVWLGSLDLVRSYHRAAQNRTALETGLDADDGLSLDFAADIQSETANVAYAQETANVTSWWKIWCVKQSVDWLYYGEYLNSSYGQMRENSGEPKLCITPGLTRASTPDYRTWKPSTGIKEEKGGFPDLRKEGYRFFVDHFFVKSHLKRRAIGDVEGYSFMPFIPGKRRAIRARSPTSAGMRDVQLIRQSSRPMGKAELRSWNRICKTFGLSMDAIRKSRELMENEMALIIEDAKAGQCSDGHTCKNSSLAVLEQLQKEAVERKK